MDSDSFIFDDDLEEIGSDVEAFCPKCKGDTPHVIITKYEDEIRRVQCNSCSDVHAFRKPRGEAEEEPPAEPERPNKKRVQKKPTWEEFFAKHDPNLARPYSFRDSYIENDIVHHPKFGVGFASETTDEGKVEITFKDARRVLVHNRKELPGAPPELARPPRPRPQPKIEKGKGKGKAAVAAEAQVKPQARPQARAAAARPAVAKAVPKPAAKPAVKPAVKAKPARRPAAKARPKPKSKGKAKARARAHARPKAAKKARAARKK